MERKEDLKMVSNKQIVLKHYISGYPKESDFEVKSTVISPQVAPGTRGVLLKNLFLACDPYMRHRMSIHHSSTSSAPMLTPLAPGSVLIGYGVAKVIHSLHPNWEEGDLVWGVTGWEEFTLISNPSTLFKIMNTTLPLSYYAGILGMPGIAAYVGFNRICSPKGGEKVFVSSGAGGVGQLVGQFAKMIGCYVVGSASTKEKVDLMKGKLGFDDAFNYKEADLKSTLEQYFPTGIDIYFDNVGGHMLDEVLLHMNVHGKIAVSGMISQYNLDEPEGVHNLFSLISKRIRMEGFVETDYRHVYPEYLELAIKLLQEEKLVYVEDIAEGLENAPSAFVGIYYGRNVGKQLIRVSALD